MRICKDDTVLVLTGANRGKKSRVLSVDKQAGKIVVEGVGVVRKAVRRSRRNPQGGLLSMEMPIPMSNVQLVCRACGKPTRVGARIEADGTKFRICKQCGAKISQLSVKRKK